MAATLVAVLGVSAPLAANAAGASGEPTLSAPLAEGLAGPLKLAVGHKGVFVSQNFAGLLTKVGVDAPLAAEPGQDLGGVSLGWNERVVYYTVTTSDAEGNPVGATLNRLINGTTSVVADLRHYEETVNPDGDVAYGFVGLSDESAAQIPEEGGPVSYTGIVDSHPYATAAVWGQVFVADAAANAILAVNPTTGDVRTVAVLPPQPLVITEEIRAAFEASLEDPETGEGPAVPACIVGLTYNFEAVPTDVEAGPDGKLYVTTLAGGPEDPSFGARSGVWKVDPWSGNFHRFGFNLAGATDLAIGRFGIYVTELFAGRVSVLRGGQPVPVIDLPDPAAIEAFGGKLYVAYDVFVDGKVATIS